VSRGAAAAVVGALLAVGWGGGGGPEVSRQSGTTTYVDLAGKLQALVATP
jgi:hypothetical protein